MNNDEEIGYLLKPELRSASRINSQDFSYASGSFAFSGIAGAGDTTAQPITDRNLQPFHIGMTPGQPVAAYLVIRDVFASIFASGGTELYDGQIIYRDTKRVEHYLANVSGSVAIGASLAFNLPRTRLISENPLDEKERTNFGEIFVRTVSVGGAGSVTVRVQINFGVQYGL
jgi:hypothetical protein